MTDQFHVDRGVVVGCSSTSLVLQGGFDLWGSQGFVGFQDVWSSRGFGGSVSLGLRQDVFVCNVREGRVKRLVVSIVRRWLVFLSQPQLRIGCVALAHCRVLVLRCDGSTGIKI